MCQLVELAVKQVFPTVALASALVGLLSCNHADSRPTNPSNGPSVTVDPPTASPSETEATTSVSPSATPVITAPKRSNIFLTLGPEGARFDSSINARLTGVVENRDSGPVEVDMCVLGSAILALEFRNAAGKRMLTIPPGMPPTAEQRKKCQATLKPSEKRKVTYGIHIFSPELPKGSYTVRASRVESNSISLTITGP